MTQSRPAATYADPATIDISRLGHVHFVGIGGAGMSPLAQISLERGMDVSGSDVRSGAAVDRLTRLGATVMIGHAAANIDGSDILVVSNAVPSDNDEWAEARRRDIPVVLRADYLAALMHGQVRVLVSGTHGKTTTTSMVTVALQTAGRDPSFAIGGSLGADQPGAHHGTGGIFVAEADEAFRSFLRLTPDVAIITNLEMDHHDVYADLDAYTDAFVEFLGRRPPGSLALLCADDPGTRALATRIDDPVQTYGFNDCADIRVSDTEVAVDGGSAFVVTMPDGTVTAMSVPIPGTHNVLNAAAAMVAGVHVGGARPQIVEGLAAFTGALRRWQRIGSHAGIQIVDDYGHHPTELAATLAAGHQANPDGRVVAVFQPHRYTRTQALGVELGTALSAADIVVVTDVYAASEPPIAGITGQLVADAAANASTDVRYVPALADVPAMLVAELRDGDLLLTMGAGDITTLGPIVLAALKDAR